MKNAKKILALLLCAVLLVCATIAGTVAYLQAQTATVTNTFTVGKVSLGEDDDDDGKIDDGLNEALVNEYGEKLNDEGGVFKDGDTLAERVTKNTYKLIPGHEYTKDPTIHIVGESEPCYLFVEIHNGIAAIEDGTTIAQQMAANDWEVLDPTKGIYYLNHTTAKVEENNTLDVPVFAKFKLKTDANVAAYANESITVIAYAVQADGFTSAADAWGKTFGATTKNP